MQKRSDTNLSYYLVAKQIIRDRYHGFADAIYSALSTPKSKLITTLASAFIYTNIANVSSGAIKDPFKPEEYMRELSTRLISQEGRDILLSGLEQKPSLVEGYRAPAYKPQAEKREKVQLEKKPAYIVYDPRKGISEDLKRTLSEAGIKIDLEEYKPSFVEKQDFSEEIKKSLARMPREDLKTKNCLEVIFEKGANYGSIDNRLKDIKNFNDIAELVIFYPLDWGFDLARGAKAVVYDIPKEALERTTKEAGLNYKSDKKEDGIVKVLFVPIDIIAGAANFTANYAIIAAKGTIQQITKRPLETIAHGVTTYAVGKWISDAVHRREHKVKVVEEGPSEPPYKPHRPGKIIIIEPKPPIPPFEMPCIEPRPPLPAFEQVLCGY